MGENLFSVFIVSSKDVDKSLNWYFTACVFFSYHDFLRLALYKTCSCDTVPKEMGLMWGVAFPSFKQYWEVGKCILIFCKLHMD